MCTQRKCDQYWPSEGEQTYDSGLTVHLLSTNVTAHYTVRMFSVRSAVKTIKKVTYLLVTGTVIYTVQFFIDFLSVDLLTYLGSAPKDRFCAPLSPFFCPLSFFLYPKRFLLHFVYYPI